MAAAALRSTWARGWRFALGAALGLSALSCGRGSGGGSGTMVSGSPPPSAANVVDVVVDAGPALLTSADVNTPFVTVTVCVPGTISCQTIDHIEVDTASFGLRLMASVLSVKLPVQTAAAGGSLLECTQFVDGYSWGPVALADVKIAGESAGSVPVQVIGDPGFTTVPTNCSGSGKAEDTVAAFGANGLLGVGVFAQDCGAGCVSNAANGFYYACTASQCTAATALLTSQVTNPIALFAADNNGVIIQIPTIPAQGSAAVTGSMIFGIDTQTNNKSGGQSVLTVDPGSGEFTTILNGTTLAKSFLDTGSNGLYFTDSSIAQCAGTNFNGFYCPGSTLALSALVVGQNGTSKTVNFQVANAQALLTDGPSFVAFATLAGTYTSSSQTFDWGLPFYYGRAVFTALENATTAVGTGPYIAF
jgi:hypothetical protein